MCASRSAGGMGAGRLAGGMGAGRSVGGMGAGRSEEISTVGYFNMFHSESNLRTPASRKPNHHTVLHSTLIWQPVCEI